MGSLKKEAQNYLDRCRVVKSTELIEGLIVEFDTIADFRIVEITKKGNEVSSKVVATFDCVGVFDEDESIKILGFKKSVFDILGRKRYYIDEGVYNFLVNEDIDEELEDVELQNNWDTAKERAYRESAEEEAAERALESYLKSQEE